MTRKHTEQVVLKFRNKLVNVILRCKLTLNYLSPALIFQFCHLLLLLEATISLLYVSVIALISGTGKHINYY